MQRHLEFPNTSCNKRTDRLDTFFRILVWKLFFFFSEKEDDPVEVLNVLFDVIS
jgi:hypothetical protein